MFVNIFGDFYWSDIISALSGAILFTISQDTYRGGNKILIFLISFFMGVVGADIAASLIKNQLPNDIETGREVGAFIASALIVTVSMVVIGRIEYYLKRK